MCLQDEVDRMVNEADKFAAEDKARRDAVETKNSAESLVYQTEKQIKELGDKVPAEVKTKVEDKIKAVRWAGGHMIECSTSLCAAKRCFTGVNSALKDIWADET
jgi:molecular chaperone DnaK (HSP70)